MTGWAKNLADGRVEVLMCGENSALTELENWLHDGPPMAEVESVAVSEENWQEFEGFTTG